jgi:hypothetical protein
MRSEPRFDPTPVIRRSTHDEDDDPRPHREPAPTPTSRKAKAALILGLLSFPGIIGSFLTALPAILFGILALKAVGRSNGRLGGKGRAIAGLITGCIGLLLSPAVLYRVLHDPRAASFRAQEQEKGNLQQCVLAMQRFGLENHGCLPRSVAYRSTDGKPLLSWRVALLPYLGEDNLFQQFKLHEPWDSPHNKKLLARMPKVFQEPGEQPDDTGLTRYQVPVGIGTAFEESGDIGGPIVGPLLGWGAFRGESHSDLILIVVADHRVPWTKPEDLPYNYKGPMPRFSKRFSGGFHACMGDGSVRFIPDNTSEQSLRAAFIRLEGLRDHEW